MTKMEYRIESRLQALEILVQQREQQHACPQEVLPMTGDAKLDAPPSRERRLHPADLRARSRELLLIEYRAGGSYVIIDRQEGELHLSPDSVQWFDWLASLPRSPAMAAGLTNHIWTVKELLTVVLAPLRSNT